MPIQIPQLTQLSLQQLKTAMDTISRNSFKLTNPSGKSSGVLYTNALPSATDLDEGAGMFVYDGVTYKLAFKINGVVKSVTLT